MSLSRSLESDDTAGQEVVTEDRENPASRRHWRFSRARCTPFDHDRSGQSSPAGPRQCGHHDRDHDPNILATTASLRVHAALRIQRTLRLRTTTRLLRVRRTVLPADERIRIPRRRLQRIALRTRLTILAIRPVDPIRTWLALGSSRTRLTLRPWWTSRTSRTRSADRTRLPSRSVSPIDAVSTGLAGTPRRARITRLTIGPRHTLRARRTRHTHTRLTRLPAQPRRASHRRTAQLLHLPRQSIPVLRQPLHPQRQQYEPRQHQHREHRELGVLPPMPLCLACMPCRHDPAPWLFRYSVSSTISTGAISAEKISLRSDAR